MTGFELLPVVILMGCYGATQQRRRLSAERQAAGWEETARALEGAVHNLEGALANTQAVMKEQGETLRRFAGVGV